MCLWKESHFHNWIDYNGVTFLVEILQLEFYIFGIYAWDKKILVNRDLKIGRFAAKSD